VPGARSEECGYEVVEADPGSGSQPTVARREDDQIGAEIERFDVAGRQGFGGAPRSRQDQPRRLAVCFGKSMSRKDDDPEVRERGAAQFLSRKIVECKKRRSARSGDAHRIFEFLGRIWCVAEVGVGIFGRGAWLERRGLLFPPEVRIPGRQQRTRRALNAIRLPGKTRQGRNTRNGEALDQPRGRPVQRDVP
jgi:hypothetical protein